jgi:hypothetical protein
LLGVLKNGGNMKLKTFIILLFAIILVKPVATAQAYNYAELWRSWDISAREAYISGVFDGITEAYFVTMKNIAPNKLLKTPEPVEVKKIREKLFVQYTRDQMRDVITDLYKDPANAVISTLDMFFLARDKIEGKDIRIGLAEARKKAMDMHQLDKDKRRK